jgi:hypothetical protein
VETSFHPRKVVSDSGNKFPLSESFGVRLRVVWYFIKGGIIMSVRGLFIFGLLCLLVAFPALSKRGDAPKQVPAVPAGDFPQFVSTGGCEVIKEENAIVLKGPDDDLAKILTAKEHKPPFVLRVKAKTDSTNVRLYYNAGMVIFNWEVSEDELRIHDPATNEIIPVDNQGKIEPNVYHDIVWEMYPNGMRVLVDGKERARRLGNYEKLEAALGIGPAWGSIITMNSFRVEALKGKLPE